MSGVQRILVIIAVFLVLIIASFVWFVSTWDPAKEESITHRMPMEEVTA
ncbi:hypothetical protein PGB28_04745 [Primorskyibacter aestuariivivens]|nr:hypothetical protein [Primorskyibacter aestuariivivens]MDA7427757.1 hypothetical protein [Primorskyibacter aestuariivivens]